MVKKTTSSMKSLSKEIKDIKNRISKVDVKRKVTSFDGNQGSAQLSTLSQNCGIFNKINEMAIGTADDQIVGNSYVLRRIKMNFLLHNTSDQAVIVRYCILRSKEQLTNQGQNLFVDDFGNGLTYSTTVTGDPAVPNMKDRFRLDFNTNKYDIITKGRVLLGANNTTVTNYQDQFRANNLLKKFKSYKGRKEYLNSSGVPDENYYLVMYAINASMNTILSNVVEVTGNTEFEYTDL